jgi:hypothetical protein
MRYRTSERGGLKRAEQSRRQRARGRNRRSDVDSVGDLGSREMPSGDDGPRSDHFGAPSPAVVPAGEEIAHEDALDSLPTTALLAQLLAAAAPRAGHAAFVCRRCGATSCLFISVADHFARRDQRRARTPKSARGSPSSRRRQP